MPPCSLKGSLPLEQEPLPEQPCLRLPPKQFVWERVILVGILLALPAVPVRVMPLEPASATKVLRSRVPTPERQLLSLPALALDALVP